MQSVYVQRILVVASTAIAAYIAYRTCNAFPSTTTDPITPVAQASPSTSSIEGSITTVDQVSLSTNLKWNTDAQIVIPLAINISELNLDENTITQSRMPIDTFPQSFIHDLPNILSRAQNKNYKNSVDRWARHW